MAARHPTALSSAASGAAPSTAPAIAPPWAIPVSIANRRAGNQVVAIANAPTKLMKSIGYSKGYQYDHDVEGGIALDQTAFPDAMGERVYYRPVPRGMEAKLGEKLDALRAERNRAIESRPSRDA